MKFPGGFSVELIRLNGSPNSEVTKGSERYIVAQPGQPFEVQAKIEDVPMARHQYIQVHLELDGAPLS